MEQKVGSLRKEKDQQTLGQINWQTGRDTPN